MTPAYGRVPPESFEPVYRTDLDPWRVSTCHYELRKRNLVIDVLPDERYRSCFEPGAGTGVLTARLAERCDRVVSMDGSPTACESSRRRLVQLPAVDVRLGVIPEDWPIDTFDLIVLAEIGYYFTADSLTDIAVLCEASLAERGTIVAVHWLGTSSDHVLHGDDVHSVLRREFGVAQRSYSESLFRIDCWERS